MIKIQIVDDHKLIVESLSKMINDSHIAQITDVYYDLESCRSGLSKSLPDILLLDIGLPDGDGVEFCAEIKKIYVDLKIIMLTTYKEFTIAKRALHYGALGYILKNSESKEMFAGISAVNKGEQFICEEIDVLLKKNRSVEIIWLSNREKETLRHIADGYTTKEIAKMLEISSETVKTYRRNLIEKLHANNTADLIRKGFEMKMIW